MSTYMPKAGDISRKWYVLDAAGKPLGRVPHMDCGDHVIIINAEKAILTGNKLNAKVYQWHTGWVGGLKEVKYSKLMEENPEKAMALAVEGMLPHNKLGAAQMRRLRVYRGAEHQNAAQNPVNYEF